MAKKKFPFRAAVVACNGGCRVKESSGCEYGCIGCGKCQEACRLHAVHINEIGVAEIDENICIACGKCVKVCPRQVIRIHDCANYMVVKCSNKKPGKEAGKQCAVSCIGCGICKKICTAEAVTVRENLAVIDETLCLSCGRCAVKCPRHVIIDQRGILTAKY